MQLCEREVSLRLTSFKYLGSNITDKDSTPEILSRIAQTTAALTRLKPVCNDRVFLSVPGYDSCAPSVTSRSFCMFLNYGPQSRAPQNTSRGNEVLPQDTTHLIQRQYYQRGSPCHDPAGNRTIRRPPDDRKETQTAVVWSCLPFIRSGQNHLASTIQRRRRQHQGLDRPGVCKVPEGSGEQGKQEETGCEITCGDPTTLAVKG